MFTGMLNVRRSTGTFGPRREAIKAGSGKVVTSDKDINERWRSKENIEEAILRWLGKVEKDCRRCSNENMEDGSGWTQKER